MRKKRAQNRRKGTRPASSGSGWAWLLFGVVLGGVLGSIGYVKWYEGRPHPLPPMVEAKKALNKIPKPQFDFYTMLPSAEVEAPRSPNAPAKPKEIPSVVTAQSPAAPKSVTYRLQLAAYKNFNDADALKAKLALSGFTVEIQSVTLEGGAVWYRVQTPTLNTHQEALQMQAALKSQAITSVLIK